MPTAARLGLAWNLGPCPGVAVTAGTWPGQRHSEMPALQVQHQHPVPSMSSGPQGLCPHPDAPSVHEPEKALGAGLQPILEASSSVTSCKATLEGLQVQT